MKKLIVLAFVAWGMAWAACPQPAAADQGMALVAQDQFNDQGLTALTDEELGEVSAGDLQLSLEDFDVMISGNEAGLFTMDIASSAFNNAQGVFTTLMAVNSAVDLTVIVNIFFNQQLP